MKQTVVQKLERKFPNSEIRIRKGKIFQYNPETGIEKYVGKSAENISEISTENNNPLYKSRSWVNVNSPGIESFQSFGKRDSQKYWQGNLGKWFAREIDKILVKRSEMQKLRISRAKTEKRNIEDVGNFRGEIEKWENQKILNDPDFRRKMNCQRILCKMKQPKYIQEITRKK